MNKEKNMSKPISNRVSQIPKSAIHEMTRLSKEVNDVAFLSWAKPISDTTEHIIPVYVFFEGKNFYLRL